MLLKNWWSNVDKYQCYSKNWWSDVDIFTWSPRLSHWHVSAGEPARMKETKIPSPSSPWWVGFNRSQKRRNIPSFFWWVSCNYTPQQAECQSGTNISPVSAHSPPTMLKPRPPCCLVSVTSLGSLKCLQLITKFTLLCFHINCENVNWSAGCVADLGRVFPSTPLKSPLYWCVYQSQGRVAKQQQRERGFMQPLL